MRIDGLSWIPWGQRSPKTADKPGQVPGLPPDAFHRTSGNRVDLLIDGDKAFSAMEAAVDGATTSIDLETFIFDRDETAWRMAEKLAVKAEQGVRVRVFYDRLGTYVAGKPSAQPAEIFQFMRDHGVEVVGYGPAEPPKPFAAVRSLWRFASEPLKEAVEVQNIKVDHRKMLVVDGKTAFTGGMNVGDHYAHEWHDMMVKIEGPVVGQFSHRFEDNWRKHGGTPAPLPPTPAAAGDVTAHTIATGANERSGMHTFYAMVARAQTRIQLEVPYLTDDRLTELLAEAARRGVKVQVIVPDPALNNHSTTAKAAIASYPELMAAGVEIYHYQGRMTHAKAMQVDDRWSTVGSTNGTNRSFRANQELNLFMDDADTAMQLRRELFDTDIQASSRVNDLPEVGVIDRLCDLADQNF